MVWDSKREFDDADLESILDRARKMKGKTLAELDIEISGELTWNKRATGWAGNVIHRWFVDDDNISEPDLRSVFHPKNGHKGLEIKVVPLDVYSQGNDNKVKWPQSLAMINFEKIHDSANVEPIEKSILFKKDRWTLVVYYRYIADQRPDGAILGIGIWNLESLMFETICQDYEFIIEMIRNGKAAELSETQTQILSARTKSSKATNRRSGGEGATPAKPRVWALKSKYIRQRMEMDGVDFTIRDDSEVIRDISIVSSRIRLLNYIRDQISSQTVAQVAAKFGKTKLGSKNVARIVATTALHHREGGLGKSGKSSARFIDGYSLKVFNVNSRMYPDNSGLRFPHTPLVELVETPEPGKNPQLPAWSLAAN